MNQKFVEFIKKANKSEVLAYMLEHKLREVIFVARKNVMSEVTLRKLLAESSIVAGDLNKEVKRTLGPLPKVKKRIKNHRKPIKKIVVVSNKKELKKINLAKKYRFVEPKPVITTPIKPVETAWDAIRWGTKVEIDKFLFEANSLTLINISKLTGQSKSKISNHLYERGFPLPTKKVGVSGVPYFDFTNKLFSSSVTELVGIFLYYGCYTLSKVKSFLALPEKVFDFFYFNNIKIIKLALQDARKLQIQDSYNFYLKQFCLADEAEVMKLLIVYRKSSLKSLSSLTQCTEGKLKSIFQLKNIDIKKLFYGAKSRIDEIDFSPKLRILQQGNAFEVYDLIEELKCSNIESMAKICNCNQIDIVKAIELRRDMLKPIFQRAFTFYPYKRNKDNLMCITHCSENEITKQLQQNQLKTIDDICRFTNISIVRLRKIESFRGINIEKMLGSVIVYQGSKHLITLHNKSPEDIIPMMIKNKVNTFNKLSDLCKISSGQLITLTDFLQINILEMILKARQILLAQSDNIFLRTLKLYSLNCIEQLVIENNCDSVKKLSSLCRVTDTTIRKVLAKRDIKFSKLNVKNSV